MQKLSAGSTNKNDRAERWAHSTNHQFQHLSSEILKNSSEINQSSGTNTLGVLSSLEESSDPADRELEPRLRGSRHRLCGFRLASTSAALPFTPAATHFQHPSSSIILPALRAVGILSTGDLACKLRATWEYFSKMGVGHLELLGQSVLMVPAKKHDSRLFQPIPTPQQRKILKEQQRDKNQRAPAPTRSAYFPALRNRARFLPTGNWSPALEDQDTDFVAFAPCLSTSAALPFTPASYSFFQLRNPN
nr:hypothetical protein Iba_chr04cCG17410 [Ipomoea batatas]